MRADELDEPGIAFECKRDDGPVLVARDIEDGADATFFATNNVNCRAKGILDLLWSTPVL